MNRVLLPVLFPTLLSLACGDSSTLDADPTPDGFIVGEGDMPSSRLDMNADLAQDADADAELLDLPPPEPEVLIFTYWRRVDACAVDNCRTSFRLGVRAGNFERLRGGIGVGAQLLAPDEQLRARTLLNTEKVRDAMESGWGCPEAAPDSDPHFGFDVTVLANNRERFLFQEVTGCVQSPDEEPADAIVEFFRELQMRYYP